MTTLAPTRTLAGGTSIPQLGLGTWPLNDAEAEAAVAEAIAAGYRLVDTAHAYSNERGVGRGVAASDVPREEVFITSKLDAEWHGVKEVHDAFAMSSEKLGVDYIDLFLIHWPNPSLGRYVDAYRGLLELREAGKIRAAGVSNFKPAHLERIIDATGVAPDVNQIELDPTRTREAARAFHAEHGILTESWSPIGQGSSLLRDPAVTEIAADADRTPAQVVLRWHVQLGCLPIPKSADPGRLRENLQVFDFALTDEHMSRLSRLDRGEAAATDSDAFGH